MSDPVIILLGFFEVDSNGRVVNANRSRLLSSAGEVPSVEGQRFFHLYPDDSGSLATFGDALLEAMRNAEVYRAQRTFDVHLGHSSARIRFTALYDPPFSTAFVLVDEAD